MPKNKKFEGLFKKGKPFVLGTLRGLAVFCVLYFILGFVMYKTNAEQTVLYYLVYLFIALGGFVCGVYVYKKTLYVISPRFSCRCGCICLSGQERLRAVLLQGKDVDQSKNKDVSSRHTKYLVELFASEPLHLPTCFEMIIAVQDLRQVEWYADSKFLHIIK